jgi:hypothetical protein
MLDKDVPPPARARFVLLGGMLSGLVMSVIIVAGLMLLDGFRSQLGGMSPDAKLGGIMYDFMDDHFVALSWVWTTACALAPTIYLARRRQRRRLAGMLAVMVPALLVLLAFVLYVCALKSGLHGITG